MGRCQVHTEFLSENLEEAARDVGCDFMEWIDLAKCRDHYRAHNSEYLGTVKEGVFLDSLSDYRIVREVM